MKLTIIRLTQLTAQDHLDLEKIWPGGHSHARHESQQLYAARFNDRLLAALRLEISGRQAIVSQLVVREVTRRRGVGKYLLADVIAQNPAMTDWRVVQDGTASAAVITAFMQDAGFKLQHGDWVKA